jgi:1-acyl-sn-glycerol-3-phosphate acyltransferase
MTTRADTDAESRRAAERTRYATALEKVTRRRGLLDRAVRTTVRLATLVVGWRVVVDGLADIPRDETGRVVPCVVAAAPHRGWPDPFLVLLAWPREAPRLTWFGDEVTMMSSWWRRRLLPRLGMIPIPARPSAAAVHGHLEAARGVLSRGCCLVVFVEKGPPSPRGRTRTIAPGAAWLAGAGGVPIVPVALGGFLETGLGTRFRVRFLPPIAPPGPAGTAPERPPASRDPLAVRESGLAVRESRVTTAALAAALAGPVAELEAWTLATNGRRPVPGLRRLFR